MSESISTFNLTRTPNNAPVPQIKDHTVGPTTAPIPAAQTTTSLSPFETDVSYAKPPAHGLHAFPPAGLNGSGINGMKLALIGHQILEVELHQTWLWRVTTVRSGPPRAAAQLWQITTSGSWLQTLGEW